MAQTAKTKFSIIGVIIAVVIIGLMVWNQQKNLVRMNWSLVSVRLCQTLTGRSRRSQTARCQCQTGRVLRLEYTKYHSESWRY